MGNYVPHDDETAMTFQVGIVGKDGVLLASDQLYTGYLAGNRQSGSGPKIIYAGKQIAYCVSGGTLALAVASYYAKHFSAGNAEPRLIEEGLLEARESVPKEFPGYQRSADGEILLAQTTGGQVGLWHMAVWQHAWDRPQCIQDRWCIGDARNSALFFVDRYAPLRSSGQELQPLDRLRLVAAHTILAAARLNPTGISGLEMLICRPEGFRFVNDGEIADLKSKSDTLDREIGHKFFPG